MFKTMVFGLLLFSIFTSVAVADEKGKQAPTTLDEVIVPGDPITESPPEKRKAVWEKTRPNPSINDRFLTMGMFVPTCFGVMLPIGGGYMNSEIQDGTSGRFVFKEEKGETNEKK